MVAAHPAWLHLLRQHLVERQWIAHNFIHNPYFTWSPLNRAFSWLLSVAMGFSQQFYDLVHHRHHQGNSDRKDEKGGTVDWLSIYRHSHDAQAESPWTYTFFGYFRDDPKVTFNEIKKRNPFNARWGGFEIASWVGLVILGFFLNWKFMLFFFPCYYFGHCLSYLNGYYLHYGGETRTFRWLGESAAITSCITGFGSTMATMRSIITVQSSTGRGCANCTNRSGRSSAKPACA